MIRIEFERETKRALAYDEELLGYIYEDDVTCTISAVINTIFG